LRLKRADQVHSSFGKTFNLLRARMERSAQTGTHDDPEKCFCTAKLAGEFGFFAHAVRGLQKPAAAAGHSCSMRPVWLGLLFLASFGTPTRSDRGALQGQGTGHMGDVVVSVECLDGGLHWRWLSWRPVSVTLYITGTVPGVEYLVVASVFHEGALSYEKLMSVTGHDSGGEVELSTMVEPLHAGHFTWSVLIFDAFLMSSADAIQDLPDNHPGLLARMSESIEVSTEEEANEKDAGIHLGEKEGVEDSTGGSCAGGPRACWGEEERARARDQDDNQDLPISDKIAIVMSGVTTPMTALFLDSVKREIMRPLGAEYVHVFIHTSSSKDLTSTSDEDVAQIYITVLGESMRTIIVDSKYKAFERKFFGKASERAGLAEKAPPEGLQQGQKAPRLARRAGREEHERVLVQIGGEDVWLPRVWYNPDDLRGGRMQFYRLAVPPPLPPTIEPAPLPPAPSLLSLNPLSPPSPLYPLPEPPTPNPRPTPSQELYPRVLAEERLLRCRSVPQNRSQ
jgi:hypothetical protein